MSNALGIPIFLLSAKYGNGYQEALQAITKAVRYNTPGMAEVLRSQLEKDTHIESEMARVLKDAVQIPARLPDNLTNQLDHFVLLQKIENNKKSQDSVANAGVQIKKVVESHKERQRKVN